MPDIERFYTQTCEIKRLAPTLANPDISEYGVVATFACHVQQLDAEQTAQAGGVFGKTWRMWCAPDADIKTSDNVEIDGVQYRVQGIDKQSTVSFAQNKHLSVTLIADLSD